MKRTITMIAMLLATAALTAQTIVSTQPENRNAIIEELTGINCQWCPAGHKVVNELIEANGGHVVGINVHAGYFSQGSPYNTTYGTAYDSQANPDGYPAGTVNRHVFSGNSTALGRGQFAQAAATIMAMPSPVNVAAVGRVNEANRQIELHIEIYYTDNSAVNTNYLNIAVLQNNVMGQQSGGQANYPEMVENGQYRHMHMLRDMLTGTWGVAIPATTGTFIDTTIVYDVPQAIGQVAIPDLNDLDFVVFVAEGHQEIITGVKAMMITDKPAIASFKVEHSDCSLTYQPFVTIANTTESDLSNFTFDYSGATYFSGKLIPSFQTDTIHLPAYTITVNGDAVQNCATTKTVSLQTCDDAESNTIQVMSAQKSISFADFNIYTVAGPFTARIGVDAYRTEASAALVNQANCQALWTESNFGSDISTQSAQYISQLPNATYFDISFSPATAGLYIFRAIDSYGDGWNMTNDREKSGIWISNADGQFVAIPWGYSAAEPFSNYDIYLNVTNAGNGSHSVGIDDVETVSFSVYPNPTSDRLTVSVPASVREITVLDITGRTLLTSAVNTLDVSSLAAGVYMVRVATENGIGVQKFVKE